MFGAHGLGVVGLGAWEAKFTSCASDAEHRARGVVGSVAGRLLDGGTDATAVPGPGVLHVTQTGLDAARLAARLTDKSDKPDPGNDLGLGGPGFEVHPGDTSGAEDFLTGPDPRVLEAIAYGIIRPPVYSVAAQVMRDDRRYGGP